MGLRETLVHAPHLDPSNVGISFTDLLFAAVVPFQLMALEKWWQLRPVGWVQLSTSSVLLLTSWIGYHNSSSRSRWLISFVNLPLVIFVLDVLMVLIYGFSAFAAEVGARTGTPDRCSPVPMAIAVALTFTLYVMWDHTNLRMKRSTKYQTAWKLGHDHERMTVRKLSDVPRRRYVTLVCWVLSLAVVAISVVLNSAGEPAKRTIIIDGVLIILLVGYRLAKDWRGKKPAAETVFVPAGKPASPTTLEA